MKRFILLLLIGWLCSEIGHAQTRDTLFVSVSQTVHVRFSSELKYVNLGSRDIVAKIVDGAKDFVALRARESFDFCTSLSCLEANGTMHTFLVAYREHPSRLEVDTRFLAATPGPAGSLSLFRRIAPFLFHLPLEGPCAGPGRSSNDAPRAVPYRRFRLWITDSVREPVLSERCAVYGSVCAEQIGRKLRAFYATICGGEFPTWAARAAI